MGGGVGGILSAAVNGYRASTHLCKQRLPHPPSLPQGKEFGAFNRWFKINSINSTGNSTLGNGVTHYLSTWIDLR